MHLQLGRSYEDKNRFLQLSFLKGLIGIRSRAVKILENTTLILASKFENFRELPSIDSQDIYCPHPHLKFREFPKNPQKLSKVPFLRAVGIKGALEHATYFFSGLWKQGAVHPSFSLEFFVLIGHTPQCVFV